MSNICFTVLHYRTPFIYELSKELTNRGHIVYFLCPSPKWKKWLLSKGVEGKLIIDETVTVISKDLGSDEMSSLIEIKEMEQNTGLTLNGMIMMDRIISNWASKDAVNYLVRLYVFLRQKIIENKIDIVIGEPTPANELLTASVCECLNVPYYFPTTVRIPDNRFAFFKGRFNKKYAMNKIESSVLVADAKCWAEWFIVEFEQKKPKPSYWKKNNKLPSIKLNWVCKFIKTISEEFSYQQTDPTRFDLLWLLKHRLFEVINRFTMQMVHFDNLEQIENRNEKFILYPLHKQPESSVDVLGDFYSDQLNLIQQIAKSLPATHKLYVKEHSNAVGDRSVFFYRKIAHLPNTRLVSPYVDNFTLIQKSDVVVTISGTMAFEAGLLDKPAITFADMFFSDLPSVRYCHSIRILPTLLDDLISYIPPLDSIEKRKEFLSDLYVNSFEGTFSDVFSYPDVIERKNIERVCIALESII